MMEVRMARKTHETLVGSQFGNAAAAYVASPVHARGPDLDQLVEIVTGHSEARAVDLGCGGGHVSFHVAPHVKEIVAYDLSPDMLRAVAATAAERGLGNIATERGVAESLPFPDHFFDFVISRFSAHHWHDLAAALREAKRVMKPGGRAIFMDVAAPPSPLLDTHLQAIELLRDPSHVRNYSVEEWRRHARAAGFTPGGVTLRRLPIEFGSWIARIRTPETHVAAIRSLQMSAPDEVAAHFEIARDGSFMLDTMTLLAS